MRLLWQDLCVKKEEGIVKKLCLYICLIFPCGLYADPHYVQALHPYCIGCSKESADKAFKEYLGKFKLPVNVQVNKYEGTKDPDSGEDWYIYIYIINDSSPIDFALDVSCPGAGVQSMATLNKDTGRIVWVKVEGVTPIEEIIGSDPVRENGSAKVTEGKLVWPLDSTGGTQGMWFYSKKTPVKRAYELRGKSGRTKSGMIDGPSC